MIKLNEKYNSETFATFLREFLPEDFEEKEQDIADVSKCKVIRRAREIGYCPSLDVTVLEMEHDKETDPRVTIATDAFKLLALYGVDKALVIFNNKDSENYRFSYLTIKLDLDEKGKIKQTYSNARRYSFFLGTGAKVKTPEQQLIKKGRVKDANDLLSRFSLEVVNKQFYLEVAKYFDELVKTEQHLLELPFQSDPNVRKSFAMRLIGRLTFCWFLKQKKSASGQLIPEQLLSSEAVRENYYHSTLEPLFFEVLNTQIDARDVRNDLYDKVPYLNGGLFSPQTDDYYDLDRGTFASKYINTLKVSDTWFKDFFLLLETYNFTIDENTVFDQELSVDPEMLGRIFENLLAEINPETGSSDRKRTGSFYTPRQIVEYMVDQSLLEYLKTKTGIDQDKLEALISYDIDDDVLHPRTDEENQKIVEAIETLKVLDPACGSGAFPMGALQKIVWILQQVDSDCKLWLEQKLAGVPDLYRQKIVNYFDQNPPDYIRKLDVIKNSIFGVDIQPIAVEISRLRCFLTLVVESEIDDRKQNRGIEPLPNLDFKFVCANTLVGLPKSEDKGLFEDHSGIEELSKIMSEYFSCSNQKKEHVRLRFANAQKEILNSTRRFGAATGDLTIKLTLWNPFSNKSNPWFDPEWMFGVEDKFDVVIGNPPYGAKIDKEQFMLIKKNYSFSANGKVESYRMFVERSVQLVTGMGIITLIIPNTWMYLEQAKPLRTKLLTSTSIKHLIVFPQSTFSATVDSMMLMLSNIEPGSDTVAHTLQLPLKGDLDTAFINLTDGTKHRQSIWQNNAGSRISIEVGSTEQALLDRLAEQNKKLGDYIITKQGLIPYLTKQEGRENKYISDQKQDEGWFEYLDGSRCVDRYQLKGRISYIKYGDWLYAPREPEIFQKPRIIYQLIRNISLKRRIVATYLDKVLYSDRNTGIIFTQEDNRLELKYILGVLNSSLLNFVHAKTHNSTYISFPSIKSLPFVIGSPKEQREVIELVEQIMTMRSNKQDVTDLEMKLDELVMEVYKLTEEEKEIIRHS